MGLEGITPERFAERLKLYRTSKGYSQEDLAKLTGLTSATICRYEGGGMAKVNNAVALARALGIAFNYLIGFIDDPYDIEVKEVTQVYNQLSNKSRHDLYEYSLYLLEKNGKRKEEDKKEGE